MSERQNQTIDLYGQLMQVNASSHLLRTARQVGVIDELREGQRTLDELCQARFLNREATGLLLDALTVIGVVERYGEDYAISQAARLLNQYDNDLGDEFWQQLPDLLTGKRSRDKADRRAMENRDTATQWTQTAAAMQAAEILDLGGKEKDQDYDQEKEAEKRGDLEGDGGGAFRILDLGCGAAVWSCAAAHRHGGSTVLGVDHEEVRLAATNTADSIGLGERFEFEAGDLLSLDLPDDAFDLCFIGRRLHYLGDGDAASVLQSAAAAVRPGGRVVVIDLFRVPSRKNLTETVEALRLELGTAEGSMRTLQQGQQMMTDAGLDNVQFTFIAASREGLGMCVGEVV